MIAAISLMRKRDDVTLAAFRRHWLDVHGPLVSAFPALRRYVQDHVIASSATNGPARLMRIDGFPILFFDNDADRLRAHQSPEMAACNVDSRAFIGAVSRVICEPAVIVPPHANSRIKLIGLLPDGASPARYVAWARELPRLEGLMMYRPLQQGPAPNSTIPHLTVTVAAIVELQFPSLVDLECALESDESNAAHFAVEEHCLV